MISCLIFFCHSVIFNFSEEEITEKIKQSLSNPVFALFYTENCLACDNIIKKADDFFDKNKARPNISFTRINCRSTDFCEKEKVYRVPFVRIYHGPNENTWGSLNSSDVALWEKLVNEHTLAKISKNSIPNVTNYDLTHFHVISPKENFQNFRKLRKLARSIFWDHAFTYQIDPSISELQAKAYLSSQCQVTENLENFSLSHFFLKYSHGIDHNYNIYEILQKKDVSSFLLFLHTDPYNSIYKNSLEQLSKQLCESTIIGHMQINDESSILNEFRISKNDLPIMAYYNKNANCYYFSKGKIVHNTFLLNQSFTNTCYKIIDGREPLDSIQFSKDAFVMVTADDNFKIIIHIVVLTVFISLIFYIILSKRIFWRTGR